ncbi:hypothetical protein VIGAN_04140200 [Vigna angularis var. angularis]|uniref:Uncharacterized protein n=1 Tax=Vigna angularis var. angularis TaxID=157739 RepID=A0A0S3RU34_PHAAN|nr:hypothetical protein VIGAN_04140200 [Vigna angularis var. angularis]
MPQLPLCFLKFTSDKCCYFHWLFNVSLAIRNFQNAQLMNLFHFFQPCRGPYWITFRRVNNHRTRYMQKQGNAHF